MIYLHFDLPYHHGLVDQSYQQNHDKKDDKDVDKAYESIPKILKFLKKSYHEDLKISEVIPSSYVKNAIILIAMAQNNVYLGFL